MGKFISLGEYNKLYKYIWIYLIIKFISLFIFDYELVFDQLYCEPMILPYGPFISSQINYLAFIIISLILIIIEKHQRKKVLTLELIESKLIYNEPNIVEEFGISKKDYFLFINLFFVVVIDIVDSIFAQFGFNVLYYWMVEMLFFEIFNIKILKNNIYNHHIFSFIFIFCSCSIIKTIIIILNFVNETKKVSIFEGRKWLIPIALIVYFLIQLFKGYVYCNEKYYLDKRFIRINGYLLLYGIFGFISLSICATVSSYVPCGDNTLPELSKKVCEYKGNDDIYYFDSYSIYIKNFSSSSLGLRIPLKIIESIFSYASNYYIYAIYKKLNPIYHICMKRLNFVVLNLLSLFNDLFNNNYQSLSLTLSILDISLTIFYLFGSFVYLEFIELHFCNLDFYIRRKINERATSEDIRALDNISTSSEDSYKIVED